MQDRKLAVNYQLPNAFISNQQNSSLTSANKYKNKKSLTVLGLIASLSSLTAVSLPKSAEAKTTIFNEHGETTIAKLPSLDTPKTIERQFSVSATAIANNASSGEIQEIASLVNQIQKKEAVKQVHTIQLGDTVSSIARKYGIPSNQLIKVNKLTNPNLIKVNHQLVIPTLELAQEHNYQQIDTEIASEPISTSSSKEFEFSIKTEPVNANNSNSQKSTSLSSLAEKKAESRDKKQQRRTTITDLNSDTEQLTATDKISKENNVNNAEVNNAEVNNTEIGETKIANPYISKLRQDIVKLRTKYRQQSGSDDTIAVVAPKTLSTTNAAKTAPETIVPQTNSLFGLEKETNTTTNLPPSEPSLASNPISIENYSSLVSLSTSNTITPDLPPLASPEEYLPDNPKFDGYMWPAQGTLTSGYGWRWGRMHKGIDIAAPIGTPIVAAASGEVIYAGWNSGGYGNLVKLRHTDGSITFYAHNHRVMVRRGQRVRQGQLIAEMGSTGRSTGPHLHFEIRPNGSTAINPMARLPRK